MFDTLFLGLVLSVVVILVMLTGYFQSPRMGLVSIGAVPGVVCGVAVILLATKTTLNIESFMGSIMCIGVSVANSVMLTTFMGDYWRSGMTALQAAVKGAKDRLRPVLMTAIAMVLGTIPMALALEKGSEMTRALGPGSHRRAGRLNLRHDAHRAGPVRVADEKRRRTPRRRSIRTIPSAGTTMAAKHADISCWTATGACRAYATA